MVFMIAAYAVFWIITFLFVVSIFNRQRSLRRDLDMVEQLLEIRRRLVEVQGQVTRGGGLYETGDRVRVTAGPFEGYEGMFDTRIGGSMRARILVEFLNRLTPAEIDVRNLEKVSRRKF